MKAEIYTRPSCPWCVRAKDLLRSKDIEYVEFTVGENGVTKETIETKIGGDTVVRTVPQIFLNGEYIGGCTELIRKLG